MARKFSFPFTINQVRRNHALEHATMNILARKKNRPMLAGHSDFGGFWILGQVDTQELQEALDEALTRLRAGDSALAISPNCGTNYAVSGILAGAAAWLVMLKRPKNFQKQLERLPLVACLVTMVLMLAHPLGPLVQERITTLARLDSLEVKGINITTRGGIPLHRVMTR